MIILHGYTELPQVVRIVYAILGLTDALPGEPKEYARRNKEDQTDATQDDAGDRHAAAAVTLALDVLQGNNAQDESRDARQADTERADAQEEAGQGLAA
jgi:hypothetical protein